MGSGNFYFKHYNTASQGHLLSTLWANGDTEAIALWWLVLELVSRFEDESQRGKITVSWSVLARDTNWKPSKCRRVLARIVPVSKIEVSEEKEGYVSFRIPNWLEYQENRGGKRSAKIKQKPDRVKRVEIREEREIAEQLQIVWNEMSGTLPKVEVISKSRIKKCAARWRELSDLPRWSGIVQRLAESEFCNGAKGWKATFDWLIANETNWVKVEEGNFDNSRVGPLKVMRDVGL